MRFQPACRLCLPGPALPACRPGRAGPADGRSHDHRLAAAAAAHPDTLPQHRWACWWLDGLGWTTSGSQPGMVGGSRSGNARCWKGPQERSSKPAITCIPCPHPPTRMAPPFLPVLHCAPPSRPHLAPCCGRAVAAPLSPQWAASPRCFRGMVLRRWASWCPTLTPCFSRRLITGFTWSSQRPLINWWVHAYHAPCRLHRHAGAVVADAWASTALSPASCCGAGGGLCAERLPACVASVAPVARRGGAITAQWDPPVV